MADGRGDDDLDSLLATMSRELVGARQADLDAVITDVLRRVREHLDADRAHLFRFNATRTAFTTTHEHHKPGVSPLVGVLVDFPVTGMGYGMGRILAGLPVEAPTLDALPPEAVEEAALARAMGTVGFLSVPVLAGGETVGNIGLDFLSHPGAWTAHTVAFLQVLGEIIAAALARAGSERALALTEERLRSFVSGSEDAIVCFEPRQPIPLALSPDAQFELLREGRVVECNAAYARNRGAHSPEALYGSRVADMLLESQERLRFVYHLLVQRGFRVSGIEGQQRLPGGEVRHVVGSTLGVVENGHLVRLWNMLRDVTEQRRAESERAALAARLAQAQRLESVGLLAGGVAHDFNNLLTAILSYTRLAERDLAEATPAAAADHLIQVRAAAERAATLVRQLLAFARRQPLERRTVDLGDIARGLSSMLRHLVRDHVSVQLALSSAPTPVHADPGQLEQVIVNLVVNAGDAIGERGTITIGTAAVHVASGATPPHPDLTVGPWVHLSVSDDGSGMTPEVRARIFEPFFTTKAMGKGTGLGLAVVYGLVQQHGGALGVDSAPGRGTTIDVWLPADTGQQPAAATGSPAAARASGGHETILLAEDDELVRRAVKTILESAGYTVLAVCDGREAVRAFDEHAARIDLVMLDAVMPGLSGRAVLEHVTARRPGTRVLLSSGYTSDVFPDGWLEANRHAVLVKPYAADKLLDKVRELLDAPERPIG